jgi:hypothetical protein
MEGGKEYLADCREKYRIHEEGNERKVYKENKEVEGEED